MADVSQILDAIQAGDPRAAAQLLPVVYDELRKLAARQMAQERPGQTLDATALVHEAYLRLLGDQRFERRRQNFSDCRLTDWGKGWPSAACLQGLTSRSDGHVGGRRRMTIDELVALYEHPDSVPPLPALAGLDRVDWSALGDAHGPATKAPALIRALASTEPEHRNSAAAALCEHIWHQGTVYSATAAAVPILYELLVADGPHDKATVAVLLATIADGKPPFAHCENDAQEAARWRTILSKAGRSLDAEMAEGRRFSAEIRRELARRFDQLYSYLRDPDLGVRVAVAIAVGQFPEIAARLLPDLQAALSEETDEHVRRVLGKVVEGLR